MNTDRKPAGVSLLCPGPVARRSAWRAVAVACGGALLLGGLALGTAARAGEERGERVKAGPPAADRVKADPRKGDHEQARAAVQAGQVMPLPRLLAQLQQTHPGQVLELELERDDGRWIYEVKLLQPDGQLLKLELDAGSGQVLTLKRRAARAAASAASR